LYQQLRKGNSMLSIGLTKPSSSQA
jgi:hypothetical protein